MSGLHNDVTYIIFGYSFNCEIKSCLKNLKCVIFGYKFNKNIDNLPEGIEHIELGENYNQTINNLPNSLIYLKCYCNSNIKKLPNNLEYLDLTIGRTNSDNITIQNDNLNKIFDIIFIQTNKCSTQIYINNLPQSLKNLILKCHHKNIFNHLCNCFKLSPELVYRIENGDIII